MVIFIAGSLGSGKSTTAKELKKLIKKSIILEPDVIRSFIKEIPIDKAVPVILEAMLCVIKIFYKKGFTIIVPYPLSKQNFLYLNANLRNTKKHFFVLNPRMEKISNGRGKRKLSDGEIKRIKHHYEIGINNPSFGINIDNSFRTPKEVAREILKNLKNSS